jgi:hypothetical protein
MRKPNVSVMKKRPKQNDLDLSKKRWQLKKRDLRLRLRPKPRD